MSRSLSLSREEYLKVRDDARLSINGSDVPYLVDLAKAKGYQDSDVATLYVIAVEGIPEESSEQDYVLYDAVDLQEMAANIDRMLYDEKNKRLVGFIQPFLSTNIAGGFIPPILGTTKS